MPVIKDRLTQVIFRSIFRGKKTLRASNDRENQSLGILYELPKSYKPVESSVPQYSKQIEAVSPGSPADSLQ